MLQARLSMVRIEQQDEIFVTSEELVDNNLVKKSENEIFIRLNHCAR